MKPKQLTYLLVLLNFFSCRITDKNLIGYYKTSARDGHIRSLKISADYTYLYSDLNVVKLITDSGKILDSLYFITKGNWKLLKNELVLNSFKNFNDTNRVRKILITPNQLKQSNFTFNDIDNNTISFNRIDDEKGNFALIVDKSYSNYSVDLTKHKTLTFYFDT